MWFVACFVLFTTTIYFFVHTVLYITNGWIVSLCVSVCVLYIILSTSDLIDLCVLILSTIWDCFMLNIYAMFYVLLLVDKRTRRYDGCSESVMKSPFGFWVMCMIASWFVIFSLPIFSYYWTSLNLAFSFSLLPSLACECFQQINILVAPLHVV